jgi:hypothetical protein
VVAGSTGLKAPPSVTAAKPALGALDSDGVQAQPAADLVVLAVEVDERGRASRRLVSAAEHHQLKGDARAWTVLVDGLAQPITVYHEGRALSDVSRPRGQRELPAGKRPRKSYVSRSGLVLIASVVLAGADGLVLEGNERKDWEASWRAIRPRSRMYAMPSSGRYQFSPTIGTRFCLLMPAAHGAGIDQRLKKAHTS